MSDYRRPPTAQEAVLVEIRRAIVTGELPPGTALRQDALAERFGVSRVPLREALKILEGEGQVDYRAHHGYVVARLDRDALAEVYRIRALLEDEAVRAAVPRLDDQQVETITVLLDAVEAAGRRGDVAELTDSNRALHFAIFEASGLPRLVRMIRILWDATDAYRGVYFSDATNRARIDDEHRAVLAALRARDADGAVRILAAHREHSVAAVSALIDA